MTAFELPSHADFAATVWLELRWFLEDHSSSEPNTGCLLWLGRTIKQGYGAFSWRSLQLLAHRAAFSLENGEIPTSIDIHHRCAQPSCINLLHLVPVTAGQHQRIHKGLGTITSASLAGGAGIDLWAAFREAQKAEGIDGLPFPMAAIGRHHGVSYSRLPAPEVAS